MATQSSVVHTRLWRDPAFALFWSGQGVSVVGSVMATLALPILVFQTTHSVAQMGLITGASGVGSLIASLVSGVLVDRVNRRGLLIVCDVLNTLLYASIPVTWFLLGPQMGLLYALAPLLGFLGTTFFIGYSAVVPRLVAREQITAANSALQGMQAFAAIIGPVLAGAISAQFGAVQAMTANALSFVVSVVTLLLVRLRPAPADQAVPRERPGWLAAFVGGLRFVIAQPTLRWMVIIRSGGAIVSSGAVEILIYRMQHDLGISAGIVGVVFGAGAVGAVLSSFVVAPIRRRFGFGFCFLGGTTLIALATILYGVAAQPAVFIVAELLASYGTVLVVINTMSLRQELTPDHLQGRVTAFLQLTIWVLSPPAVAASTALAARAGATLVLVAMGAAILVLILIGIFTPVNAPHPEQAEGR